MKAWADIVGTIPTFHSSCFFSAHACGVTSLVPPPLPLRRMKTLPKPAAPAPAARPTLLSVRPSFSVSFSAVAALATSSVLPPGARSLVSAWYDSLMLNESCVKPCPVHAFGAEENSRPAAPGVDIRCRTGLGGKCLWAKFGRTRRCWSRCSADAHRRQEGNCLAHNCLLERRRRRLPGGVYGRTHVER